MTPFFAIVDSGAFQIARRLISMWGQLPLTPNKPRPISALYAPPRAVYPDTGMSISPDVFTHVVDGFNALVDSLFISNSTRGKLWFKSEYASTGISNADLGFIWSTRFAHATELEHDIREALPDMVEKHRLSNTAQCDIIRLLWLKLPTDALWHIADVYEVRLD